MVLDHLHNNANRCFAPQPSSRFSRPSALRCHSLSKKSPGGSSRTTTTCFRRPSPLSRHLPVALFTPLPPQFCYQHAQRIHPSTDFSTPHRPSSAPPPHISSLPNYMDAGAASKAAGRGGGRAPQGRNVAWNRSRDTCHPHPTTLQLPVCHRLTPPTDSTTMRMWSRRSK